MDQTTSEDQKIPGHQRERGQDANLVRRVTYVLIAIVKKKLQLDASLYTWLQILSVSVFEKTQLSSALQPDLDDLEMPFDANQLNLFNF